VQNCNLRYFFTFSQQHLVYIHELPNGYSMTTFTEKTMMKPTTLIVPMALAALAACALLSGCAANPQPQSEARAEAGTTTLGSLIPRKKSAGTVNNVGNADLQALENARNNGNGVMNLPGK
jgi:hypothetical protein